MSRTMRRLSVLSLFFCADLCRRQTAVAGFVPIIPCTHSHVKLARIGPVDDARATNRCTRDAPVLLAPVDAAALSDEQVSHVSPHADTPIGLYIHIPYCRRRCRYCNFAIIPVGSTTDDGGGDAASQGFRRMDEQYLQALLTEIRSVDRSETGDKIPLRSVYFGGGTPSLAPVETVASILDAVCRSDDAPFVLQDGAEVTMEMDPGTFTTGKLRVLKSLGINRVSLGVQSFDNQLLETMGRMHRYSDIVDAVAALREVFGDDVNFTIDLISGLPGLSLALWAETLSVATEQLRPSHISIYDLQVEQGTVFGNWYKAEDAASMAKLAASTGSTTPLPSEEECAFMYKFAAGYLRYKGFEHYEVSSYAASPDFRSRHNQIYWSAEGQWHAFGLGSTSNVNRQIVARPRALADYQAWVEHSRNSGDPIENDVVAGDEYEREYLTDVVMKRLRTSDGLDLDWLSERFGDDVKRKVLDGAQLGFDLGFAMVVDEESNGKHLRLSDPDGFLYSNYIISNIFVELDGSYN